MNAGAYDGTVSDVISKVESIPELKEYGLSYRHSNFMEQGAIILGASFKLRHGDQDEINAKISDFTKRRTTKQPLAFPSAGSFFKRPEGYFAGKLIEDAGLKGRTVGGAQISELHAGFMINIGGATCADIMELMHIVQSEVYEKFGVRLEPEVRIIEE